MSSREEITTDEAYESWVNYKQVGIIAVVEVISNLLKAHLSLVSPPLSSQFGRMSAISNLLETAEASFKASEDES